MTVRRFFLAWVPSFACLSPLGACRSEAGVDAAAEFDDFANAECNVTPHAAYEAPAGSAGMAGTGLDLVVSGTSTSDFTSKRFIAAGAPTALTTGGKLRVIEASRSTGLVTTLKQTFLAPVLSKSFGTSAYAANWRDCHTGADGAGFWDGCGQEILVGAPDIGHGTTGLVYWFEPNGDSSGTTQPFQFGGSISPPAASGAIEFGSAITAPDASSSGGFPSWLAISAPASGQVFLYTVDGSGVVASTATITGAKGFGFSLAAADFNDDDVADLAVGMPGGAFGTTNGRVFVYRGTGTIGGLAVAPPLVLDGTSLGTVTTDEFGFSIAAGEFIGSNAPPSLAVGVPGLKHSTGADDAGGVCQFAIETYGALGLKIGSVTCTESPFGVALERMGHAVATGNFYAMDSNHALDTVEALQDEVAIGRPGAGTSGAVDIWGTNETGIEFDDFESFSDAEAAAGSKFGQRLAAARIQNTPWEDLAIAAPFYGTSSPDGMVKLTRADEAVAGAPINGIYEFVGINGLTREITVVSGDTSTFLRLDDTSAFGLFDGSTQCDWTETVDEVDTTEEQFEIPAGFLFVLPEPWAGDAVQVYDDVDMIDFVLALMDLDGEGLTAGQEILRGVIALAAPTADFTLTFDETAGTLSMSIAMDTSAQNLLNSVPDMSSTACGMQAIDMTLVSPGACE